MPKPGFMLRSPLEYSSWSSFGEDLATVADLGFEGVEIHMGDPADIDAVRLRGALGDRELELCSIATGPSYSDEGLCLVSPEASVRANAAERLKAYVDVGERFGSVIVVGLMQGLKRDEPDRGRANGRLVECLWQVAAYAERKGVLLVVEPINRFEVGHNHTAAGVLEVLDRVRSPSLTVVLDTFHINIEESSLEGPVWLVGDRLGLVHVLENHRGLFGSGHMDLARILRATLEIGYEGYWVFGDFSPNSLAARATAVMDYLRQADLIPRSWRRVVHST